MKKIDILFGVIIVAFTIYKIKIFKIGPCSPEMELLINGK